MKKLFISLIFLFAINSFASQDLYPFENPSQSQRFHHLTQNFRCLVCQNQSISDSDAPLANDLRKVVYEHVLSGKTDKEIETYLIDRYGSFVVFTPPIAKHTFILWGMPFILLLLGIFIVISIIRKARRIA